MDTLDLVTVLAGVFILLLVQMTRAIGAFRLRFLTVSLAEMARNTSQENARKEIETKMHSLVKHMRADSFVDISKGHSRPHLHLIVAGSYAVLFGIVLVGLLAVYAMIDVSAGLVIDSLVSMYIGSGRFYLDMVNNYIILMLLILYLSVVL